MNPLDSYKRYHDQENKFGLYYESEDGVEYDDLESFLQSHVMGFCGCGSPASNLELIYELISFKELLHNKKLSFADYNEKVKNYLVENIENVRWFFDYFLDKKDMTEHGGNVSGGWLCDENFFNALKIWHEEYSSSK